MGFKYSPGCGAEELLRNLRRWNKEQKKFTKKQHLEFLVQAGLATKSGKLPRAYRLGIEPSGLSFTQTIDLSQTKEVINRETRRYIKQLEEHAKNLTPEEALQGLIRAGLVTKSGKPTRYYRNSTESDNPHYRDTQKYKAK